MADYNLNGVPFFKEESIMYYIRNNNYICVMLSYLTLQAFRDECTRHKICSRGRYIGNSQFHMAIMSSLDDYMAHSQ